ncbi:MAG: septum formation initiator family protein [Candidatus Pacebacteria bacterium]|nr:septum formation initiator family protein [Candidatus Paceibacterota bacterium]
MRKRKKTYKKKTAQKNDKGFLNTFLVFVLILALGFMMKNIFVKYGEFKKMQEEYLAKEKELSLEKKQNKDLQQKLKLFENEEFLKKETKDKLNLVEPGEKVIYIIKEENKNEEEKQSSQNLWDSLKSIFERK